MNEPTPDTGRPRWAVVAALLAIAFGVITVWVGVQDTFWRRAGQTRQHRSLRAVVQFRGGLCLRRRRPWSVLLETLGSLSVSGNSHRDGLRIHRVWNSYRRRWGIRSEDGRGDDIPQRRVDHRCRTGLAHISIARQSTKRPIAARSRHFPRETIIRVAA